MAESVPLGFLNRSVPSGSHVCVFYSDSAGRDEILMPFLAHGLRTGQKCICVLASLGPGEVAARLGHHVGLDLPVETSQLELATPAETYLRSGRFSAEEMLAYWQDAATAAQTANFGVARAAGEMPRELDHGGRRDFMKYEASLTESVSSLPEVIICLYDLRLSGAEVLMDVLRTHPLTVVDGVIHDNPYHVPLGPFLSSTGGADGRQPA